MENRSGPYKEDGSFVRRFPATPRTVQLLHIDLHREKKLSKDGYPGQDSSGRRGKTLNL